MFKAFRNCKEEHHQTRLMLFVSVIRSTLPHYYKNGIKRAIFNAFSRNALHMSFRRFERDIRKRQVSSTATTLTS